MVQLETGDNAHGDITLLAQKRRHSFSLSPSCYSRQHSSVAADGQMQTTQSVLENASLSVWQVVGAEGHEVSLAVVLRKREAASPC